MTQSFYSNGKLLITGEYVVLDGAKALAVPTKLGQYLDIEPLSEPKIIWTSIDEKGAIWFQDTFNIETLTSESHNTENSISKQLTILLKTAKKENPSFLMGEKNNQGYKVTTRLGFPRDWGLGSSSTLINNLALWANVNPMMLLLHSFGGSGYDIACARHNTPILYQVGQPPIIEEVSFNPRFKDEVFFVHRNKKQNSRESINTYKQNKTNSEITIQKINKITTQLLKTDSRFAFDALLTEHETLIAEVTNQTPIKEDLFPDYKNTIKSLGGWGGDFILVTGSKDYVYDYFNKKDYNTILSYSDLILGA